MPRGLASPLTSVGGKERSRRAAGLRGAMRWVLDSFGYLTVGFHLSRPCLCRAGVKRGRGPCRSFGIDEDRFGWSVWMCCVEAGGLRVRQHASGGDSSPLMTSDARWGASRSRPTCDVSSGWLGGSYTEPPLCYAPPAWRRGFGPFAMWRARATIARAEM